jgi:hypothetical protein
MHVTAKLLACTQSEALALLSTRFQRPEQALSWVYADKCEAMQADSQAATPLTVSLKQIAKFVGALQACKLFHLRSQQQQPYQLS